MLRVVSRVGHGRLVAVGGQAVWAPFLTYVDRIGTTQPSHDWIHLSLGRTTIFICAFAKNESRAMKSRAKTIRQLCALPVLALVLQVPQVHAGMLGPEQAIESPAHSGAEQDRAKVLQFLDRANVKERLQAMGVDAVNAHDRVNAMSDEEVHALAQRMDAMPAGGALSQYDLILILLLAILLLVAL